MKNKLAIQYDNNCQNEDTCNCTRIKEILLTK